ncbi:MAG TPA: hypothetical protein VHY56_07815 [Candidatus Binataceae bacterium]|nr:hypothetical protein [Candidatus Binataceae bacterium]
MEFRLMVPRKLRRIRKRGFAFSVLALALLGLGIVLRPDWARAQDNPRENAEAPDDGAADNDWQVLGPQSADEGAAPRTTKTPAHAAAATYAGVFVACGERVTLPSPEVATIVGHINELWHAHVRVYQTVAPSSPHAAAGGCIFYNRAALLALLGGRMQVSDAQIAGPLLYTIFAHEVGHELHQDLAPSRAGVPNRVKELEADRFAGFTMQKLEIPAAGLAPYWSMAGDEFGSGAAHGSSGQRVDAFRQGWELAEWNRPESSGAVRTGGTENGDSAKPAAVAPDEPAGAP